MGSDRWRSCCVLVHRRPYRGCRWRSPRVGRRQANLPPDFRLGRLAVIVSEGLGDASRQHRQLRPSQPFSDRGDKDGGFEAGGEFVESGGDSPVLFEAVDPALDRMTFAVVDRVEARWPAAAGAELSAVARLVGLVRDGAADPASAQIGAVPAGGVRLVRPDPIGADTWPAGDRGGARGPSPVRARTAVSRCAARP